MLTPEQIEDISFGTAKLGGYVKQDVDAFLHPLVEDYLTLYKENGLLKSKMRVLVTKLEEYRAAEASMKEAVVNTQKSCDAMVAQTKAKCDAMLEDAGAAAKDVSETTETLVQAENNRLEEAKQLAYRQITEMQKKLDDCVRLLGEIRDSNMPTRIPQETTLADDSTGAVADEISASLEALVGGAEEDSIASTLPPLDADSLATKFANLQFGTNYNPDKR